MGKFYGFFLSLNPVVQVTVFALSVCTGYAVTGFVGNLLDWLFRPKQIVPKPPSGPDQWNIAVTYPLKHYQEVAVFPVGVDPRSSGGSDAYIIEGPFFDLDVAIARKDALQKKL